ncbi:unnamed protein product [Nyctereutes procyonoides]|uniref:(raccoon dog) hypothetical protein n=1 Tax=Nyctereutes procyonoides TaxID=34880 RepID=A0A811YD50_NYCPR|nr:unnamed protein product [Nyctereutes procyonoides]
MLVITPPPPPMSQEEEALQKKFNKLKKKKKALLALKKQSSSSTASQGGGKRSRWEQPAKQLKSAAFSATKAETKNSGSPRRPQRKSLYEGFVLSSDRLRDLGPAGTTVVSAPGQGPRWGQRQGPFRRSDSFPERRAPRKGNTVYACGEDMTPTLLRGALSPFGNIIDLSMEPPRNCAFVPCEKMETLKVSIARKEPMLDAAPGNPKGCHRDKRTQIVYSHDVYKGNLVDGF